MPKISVITTFYNSDVTLKQCVESIKNQTYQDYEHILVDDGSTDDSALIIKELANSKIILLQPGKIGRAKALNIGLQHARGEYVAVLDADDFAHDARLLIQNDILDKNTDLWLTCSNAILVDQAGSYLSTSNFPSDHHSLVQLLLNLNPFPHSSVMYRRDFVLSFGGYNVRCEKSIDYNLYLEILANGGSMSCHAEPLISLRSYPDSWGKVDRSGIQIRFGILGLINYYFVTHRQKNFLRASEQQWMAFKLRFDQWFERRGFAGKWEAKKLINQAKIDFMQANFLSALSKALKAMQLDSQLLFYRGCGFRYPQDVLHFLDGAGLDE